jgi:hypothetical protein
MYATIALVYQVPNNASVQHNKTLFEWLSPLEPWKKHEGIREAREVSGTSRSLLEEFLKWISDPSESFALCAFGSPGAGKTIATYVG